MSNGHLSLLGELDPADEDEGDVDGEVLSSTTMASTVDWFEVAVVVVEVEAKLIAIWISRFGSSSWRPPTSGLRDGMTLLRISVALTPLIICLIIPWRRLAVCSGGALFTLPANSKIRAAWAGSAEAGETNCGAGAGAGAGEACGCC